MIEAWHFVGDTLHDGRPVPADGETLRHDGPLMICASGLHASKRIIDALCYASGDTICRVLCAGDIVHDRDKLVCTERTIWWRVNGENLLREFARERARSVLHLWDAPAVVRQYLETGDEAIRDAAKAAARDVAMYAVTAVARAAATAASTAAARDSATTAATAAATTAARATAWATAWTTAWGAPWTTARDAAMDAANDILEHMVTSTVGKE